MATEEQKTDAEREHHPFSPSSLALREKCPRFVPRNTSSAASEAGTRQHKAVEIEEDDDEMEDFEADAVVSCIEFCERLAAEKYGNECDILTESYFPVDNKIIKVRSGSMIKKFKGTTAGYCDRIILSKSKTEADLIDWKFGRYSVEDAEFNIQGISYALGVFRAYPSLKRVTVHLISPHRDEWSFHTFERETDVAGMYLRVVNAVEEAIDAANTGFEKATPSFTACLFCGDRGKCSKLEAKLIELGKRLDPLSIPEELTPELMHDPKDISIGIKLAGVVKGWADDFRSTANLLALESDIVPEGYTLVPGRRRSIISNRGVIEVAKKFGLGDEDIDNATELHISKIEKSIKLKSPRGSKDSRAKEFQDTLEGAKYVEYGQPYAYLKQTKGTTKEETI